MAKRKDRNRRINAARQQRVKGTCSNCGEPYTFAEGGHFVPPSLGEPGFFHCEPAPGRIKLEGSIFPTPASHVVRAEPVRVNVNTWESDEYWVWGEHSKGEGEGLAVYNIFRHEDVSAFGDGSALTEGRLREARDFIIDGGADRFDVVAGGDSVSGLAARGAPRYRAARDLIIDMPFDVTDAPENNAAIEGILSTGEEE